MIKREKGLYKFFKEMEKSGIDYCIMNSKDKIYDENSDIDIAVDSIRKFEGLLLKLREKEDVKIVQKLHHGYKSINYFIIYENDLLSLDIYESYSFCWRVFFDKEYFLNDKQHYKFFYIPSSEKEFLYYTVKKIIKEDIEKKVQDLIFMFKSLNGKISPNHFRSYFSKSCEKLYKAFKKEDTCLICSCKERLKKELILSRPISLKVVFSEVIRITKRIIHPTGLVVAFLGPDGVGKSTIIKQLEKENLPFRRIDYFHLKPRILGKKGDGEPVTNPHSKPPHKGIISYFKLFYFAADYILGYLIKVLPLKIRSSLIIFDRYYDDILIDPKRYRYSGRLTIARWLRKLIPKPDIYIILTTKPEIIYLRKQEVDFEDLKRQLITYEQIVDNQRYFPVKASLSPSRVTKEVIRLILDRLEKRLENEIK